MKGFLFYNNLGTAICGSPDSYRGASILLRQFGQGLGPFEHERSELAQQNLSNTDGVLFYVILIIHFIEEQS
ncbi:MAG: hypothetical protein DI539_09360 [Flavobacterium psychrophilum]|nr:MAG: hypothetical protein DI539_09360 [Flavobacterium psychrophilum]